MPFPIGTRIVGCRWFGSPTPSVACRGRSGDGGKGSGTGSNFKRRFERWNEPPGSRRDCERHAQRPDVLQAATLHPPTRVCGWGKPP